MTTELVPVADADPDEVERFRVLIEARTRHADLWPLVRQMGSQKAVAEAVGTTQQTIGHWVNLRTHPNPATDQGQTSIDRLHTLTGKTFDEMWPAALRRAITRGVAAQRREAMVVTGLLELASRQAERLVLPPADEEATLNEPIDLELLFKELTFREREIVKLRLGLGDCPGPYSLMEVARIFKITVERVRQIESKAYRKLGDQAAVLPVLRDHVREQEQHRAEQRELDRAKAAKAARNRKEMT